MGQERHGSNPVLDLTLSNPTLGGFEYPLDLLEGLADPRSRTYEPTPFGLPGAREAVAAYMSRNGATVHPDQVVLTSSTSEAYSFLFKLLADPGDPMLFRAPGYPLLEHLGSLEGVRLIPCASLPRKDWSLDPASFPKDLPADLRGMLMVDPNNPTGNYLSQEDKGLLRDLFQRHPTMAYISDEVFFDYPHPGERPPRPWAPEGVLSFRLGGLSKSAGLPQLKLSWIVMEGPPKTLKECRERLELIADTFLSVSTPVQWALPGLLKWAPRFQEQVLERIGGNLRILGETLEGSGRLKVWRSQGGWTTLVEVLQGPKNSDLALELLEKEGVLVHPGGLYDLPGNFLVLSLLPGTDIFQTGVQRLARCAGG